MTRNLLPEKEKYYKKFANDVYAIYRQLRFGIASCSKLGPSFLDGVRKEIVDYQANDDGDALTTVSIQHMGWLPIYYSSQDHSVDYCPPWADMNRYKICRSSCGPTSLGMSYNNQNIIEVNAGGCITRINVNPNITINNNNGITSFIFEQTVPATVWDITHNMGQAVNVFTEDSFGNNIEGTIDIIDDNHLKIYFNTPIAGKAYIS